MDRFFIGSMLAISAVAYYTAPYEIVTRLWIIPAALTGVLFPAMAAAPAGDLSRLYRKGIQALLALVLPIALSLALFARQGLGLWLGEDFAERSTLVAQILCLGTAVNCLAYMPFTLLQARGRADLTAKAHALEFPLYLLVLVPAIYYYGIEGAAFAWALRCAADAAALFFLARPLLRSAER